MVEGNRVIPISDRLFHNERVKQSLEERGFSRIPYSLVEQNIAQLRDLVITRGLELVLGKIRVGVGTGKPELRSAAFVFRPESVETALLPSDSDGLHEMIPEVLRLQDEGWPIFFTERGTEILRPKEALQRSA